MVEGRKSPFETPPTDRAEVEKLLEFCVKWLEEDDARTDAQFKIQAASDSEDETEKAAGGDCCKNGPPTPDGPCSQKPEPKPKKSEPDKTNPDKAKKEKPKTEDK